MRKELLNYNKNSEWNLQQQNFNLKKNLIKTNEAHSHDPFSEHSIMKHQFWMKEQRVKEWIPNPAWTTSRKSAKNNTVFLEGGITIICNFIMKKLCFITFFVWKVTVCNFFWIRLLYESVMIGQKINDTYFLYAFS